MANYNELKTAIRQVVRANDNQEITGSNLQEVLLSMVSSLGDNFQFAGIAIPSTNPGTPDQNIFYIAGPGSYVNFGNYTVPGGSIGIFTYDGSWDKQSIDIAESSRAAVGYFVCDTAAATAAKTIAATGYALATGGNIRIKMTNANTADAVTLNINGTGAKALFYNGAQASSTNSWEANEVVEVYYDGTRFHCLSQREMRAIIDNVGLKNVSNLSWITNSRITTNGELVTTNNFRVSSPIRLLAGETIIVTTLRASTPYSTISLFDGISYTPVYTLRSTSDYYMAYYTAENNCEVVICSRFYNTVKSFICSYWGYANYLVNTFEDKKNILDHLVGDIKYSSISIVWEAGKYIKTDGTVGESSSYSLSNRITLSTGQTLAVNTRGAGTKISVISLVVEESGNISYTPVALGGSPSGYFNSFYTAEATCEVVISTRYSVYTSAYLLDSNGFFNYIYKQLIDKQGQIDVLNQNVSSITPYSLPTSFSSKIEDLNTLKEDKFSILIQTDVHYKVGDNKDYGNDVKELTKYIGFDLCANLGDIIEGYSDMTKEIYRQSMTEIIKRYVDGICCPFFYCRGNHESNAFYAATLPDPSEGYIYKKEVFGRTMIAVKNTAINAKFNRGEFYYYCDYDDVNIRCIFLDTNSEGDSGFGISSTQTAWIENVALNTTKDIIVFSHVPLRPDLDPDSTHNNTQSMRDVSEILANHNADVDKSDVLCCLCGHIHQDLSVMYRNVLHISFKNGWGANAVFIDKTNRTIVAKSLGYSNDRSFTF